MEFIQQFDLHSRWRQQRAQDLARIGQWLGGHDLLDDGARARLAHLQSQFASDRVMVAFVAEFSRGKSELINAIFFAGYGRRIMPASAGRTTMCPTELGYEAGLPPCLRLLPIETRMQAQSLLEWRSAPEQWQRIDLDVNQPEQLAQAIEQVAQTLRVPVEQARALGFWHEDNPQDNPLPGPDGLVEVPRWRHALINMAHPLLKQGLVIVDTPGLNAIGTEPELTVGMLPQAHAVVFILAADAGVSKSDLAIWREHLAPSAERGESRLVVLNKIDVLWDELSSPQAVEAQIERQRLHSAEVLGLQGQQVYAVSAHKGLLAKVRQDAQLLQQSRLPELERALADDVLGQRRRLLQSVLQQAVHHLRTEVERQLQVRSHEIEEQVQELQSLRGKNATVIRQMRARIELEQAEFDQSALRIQAVRSVHLKTLRLLFAQLGSNQIKAEVAEFAQALKQPGVKLGVKTIYKDTFARLRGGMSQSQHWANEVQDMLSGMFRSLNAEYGFTLQTPQRLDLTRFVREIDGIESAHLQYLGLTNLLRLTQVGFCERLAKAVLSSLRKLYEEASSEAEIWSKTAASQLDGQLRERKRNFARRIEAVHRIQEAAGSLDERINELLARQAEVEAELARWLQLCAEAVQPDADGASLASDIAAPDTPLVPLADKALSTATN